MIPSDNKKSIHQPSFFHQHSKRTQLCLVLIFFVASYFFLLMLEVRLNEQQRKLAFNYKEFYLKPFHYKLDPFSYVELKNGVPITEPEPPNPHFALSFEEQLVNRFVDYFFWTRGPTDEADFTFEPDRFLLTIQAFGGHLRNRIYYQLDRDELHLNPILLESSQLPNDTHEILTKEDTVEVNKLVWTTIPYCTDPLLEEALHELGNIHGFLFVRGNHKNYRYLDEMDSTNITTILGSVPVKLAYLYDHSFLNFTRNGFKRPVHVSIICDPIQKKLNHFYTERHNYRNWVEDFPISSTKWWKTDLEECMAKSTRECKYAGVDVKRRASLDTGRTWLPRRAEWTVPLFCDYDRCMELGNESDLEYAKGVVRSEYDVVGTLEKLDDTLELFEAKAPQFFKGIKKMYREKVAKADKSEKYGPKIPDISPAIRVEMEKRFKPEIDFYRFVSERLQKQSEKINYRH